MPRGLRTAISGYLYDAQIMIENASADEEIKNAVSVYGYDETKLKEGKALYEETAAWINNHRKKYGEKFESTAEVQKAWEEADNAFMKTLKVARIALHGNIKAMNSLMLTEKRKQSISGWLDQADAFYRNLTSENDFITKMGKFGYNKEKLNKEFELVKTVAQKNMKQKMEMGNAQDSTVQRDKKIDELEKWFSEFRSILKVALDANPQKLEKVGIITSVPGSKGKKKEKNGKDVTTEAKV